jgi:hypothetical protein
MIYHTPPPQQLGLELLCLMAIMAFLYRMGRGKEQRRTMTRPREREKARNGNWRKLRGGQWSSGFGRDLLSYSVVLAFLCTSPVPDSDSASPPCDDTMHSMGPVPIPYSSVAGVDAIAGVRACRLDPFNLPAQSYLFYTVSTHAKIRERKRERESITHVVDVCYTSYECGENSSPHEHISSRPLGKCKVLVHILPLNSSAPVLADHRTSSDERTI